VTPTPRLLRALRRALAASGTPARAEGARAYMKSAMPFHGVNTETLRAICRRVFVSHPVEDAAAWRRDVLGIWRGARFREERYAAIELTGDRRARDFQTMASLQMYEEMIVTGAWWDLVDALATKRLGDILRHEAVPMRKVMRAWSRSVLPQQGDRLGAPVICVDGREARREIRRGAPRAPRAAHDP
jgi:3-methyladenine DNA glycosylase AlkD